MRKMNEKRNNTMKKLFHEISARKKATAADAFLEPRENPQKRPVPASFQTVKPGGLEPLCPDPTSGSFTPLTDFAVSCITKAVMRWLDRICQQRGSKVDRKYWESCTREILSISDPAETAIIPARAGAGKSTWILAFLLALCEMIVNDEEIGTSVGGVVLVVQKVETINEVVDELEKYFPGWEDVLMAALQGWTKSGSNRGFCQDPRVTSAEQCKRDRCRYAMTCKVLQSGHEAETAFIVGMTQVRFSILRDVGDLERYLTRQTPEGAVRRRFLIFDEKFEFAPATELGQTTLNAASDQFEALAVDSNISDSTIRRLQTQFEITVCRPFQSLRRQTVFEDGRDKPFGLCSLAGADETEAAAFFEFQNSFEEGYRKAFRSKALIACFDVMSALYRGRCLYCKSSGTFRVLHAEPPAIQFGETQSVIFDATAEVDGDYQRLSQVRWLEASPVKNLANVTFHVYQHRSLNVSRSAFDSSWRLPALAELTNEIVSSYPHDTFLCTYKDLAPDLQSLLSSKTLDQLARMPESDGLPYFGGTNGSNSFNHCSNVILLGYPRLSPIAYLFRAYAVWNDSGLYNELLRLNDDLEPLERNPRDVLRRLPSLVEYETRHLAARLEQEIYRCSVRNYDCSKDIHIFLFSPPEQVWMLLQERFKGCKIEIIREVPSCVSLQRLQSRLYSGRPTAFSKVVDFFEQWDGSPIRPSEIRSKLEISESAWAEIRKSPAFLQLLKEYRITQSGRGRNAVFQAEAGDRAS